MPSSFLEFILETQQASRPYDPYAPTKGTAVSGTPVNPVRPVNTGPVYPLVQKILLTKLPKTASPDGSEAKKSAPKMIGKVRSSKRREQHQSDKRVLRTNSKKKPYMCGYPDCGETYTSTANLRFHLTTQISQNFGVIIRNVALRNILLVQGYLDNHIKFSTR